MTVCVAAICDANTTILGAADRMITAGDVQFEPPDIKIAGLTSSLAVMTAGDSALHAEILQNVRTEIKERILYDPDEWLNIKDVADMYTRYYNETRTKRAERAILAPLGLDTDSFIRRQQEMSSDFVSR
jgi:hypothetical protein